MMPNPSYGPLRLQFPGSTTPTFRVLTWALTRSAALGAPNAYLRFLGEIFDNMLKIALCAIAEVYREITSEDGIGKMLTTSMFSSLTVLRRPQAAA